MNLLDINDLQGTYPSSYYAAATKERIESLPPLQGALEAEVCIIGGGFTGLSCGLCLAQSGLDVVLIEAQRIGWGASGRNGGQLGSGQRADQDWIAARHGKDAAKELWAIAERAKDHVKHLIKAHEIACDFREGVAHLAHQAKGVNALREEQIHLEERYDYAHLEWLEEDQMRGEIGSDHYRGGYVDWGAGHLNPLALSTGLARAAQKAGLRIYENTRALAQDGLTISLEGATLRAKSLVIACNGYLGTLNKEIAAHVLPINNYIIATEPLSAPLIPRGYAIADDKFVVNYFREASDGRMIFGGGESYGYQFPKDIEKIVRPQLTQVYPELRDKKIDYAWGGTLAVTPSRTPYISEIAPNIYSASGYSGHGVALANYCGLMIAKAILGDRREFLQQAVLNPKRFPGGSMFRKPIMNSAMYYFALRDRLGF